MRQPVSILTLVSFVTIITFSNMAAEVASAQKEVLESTQPDSSKKNPEAPRPAAVPSTIPTAVPAAPSTNAATTTAPAPKESASPEAVAASLPQPTPTEAQPPPPVAIAIMTPFLSKLEFNGTVQLKGIYHDFTSPRDSDKRLSLTLRQMKVELDGAVDSHFGFKSGFLLDGNNKALGIHDAYLYYTISDLVGFKGGKLKRPFSQEALQSSKSLYTIERGELYHDFLTNTVGYANYDVGLMAYGGFEEEGKTLGYELGIFNGKQNDNPAKDYGGQHYETTDKGFLAKDVVMRVTASPFKSLNVEAAVSTKAAEDTTDKMNYGYNVNTGYEVGLNLLIQHLRLMGELAWGDNHNKVDSKIISGGSLFFSFYSMAVWREDYSHGRASETVLKMEGLDPDFEPAKGEGKPNDGMLRYTFGSNYFFNPRVSLMGNYTILQPVTGVSGEKAITQGLDLMWRLTF